MSNNQYTYRETYRREDDRDNNQGGWKSWLGLDDNKNKDEYHYTRTVNRGGDDRDSHQGGWKSWFGMDDNNKSRDNNNDYHYAKTTTYRNTDGDNYPRSTNYSSDNYNRGNTGYSTSTYVRDSDRDTGYNRSYGNTDRDTHYTRAVDRQYTTGGSTGGYTGGYSSSDNYNRGSSGYTGGHTGGYSTSSDSYRGGNTGTSSSYGPRGGYGYQTSSEYNRGGMSGNTGYSGDRDTTTHVRSYTTDRDSGYSRDHPSSYESSRYSSGGYGGNTTSYGGGYGGNTSSYGDRDRYGGSSSFTTRSNY